MSRLWIEKQSIPAEGQGPRAFSRCGIWAVDPPGKDRTVRSSDDCCPLLRASLGSSLMERNPGHRYLLLQGILP